MATEAAISRLRGHLAGRHTAVTSAAAGGGRAKAWCRGLGRRRSPWHSRQHGTSQRAAGTGAPCTRNTLRCACPRPARVRENQHSFRWQPAPPSLCRAGRSGRGSLSAPRRWSGSLPALSAEAKAGADVSLSQTTRGKTPAPRDPLLPLPLPTKSPTPTFTGAMAHLGFIES